MASSPITSWQIEGGKNGNRFFLETVIFLSSNITTDSDWSHEIKRCLLLGRKAMTNLDSMLKSKDITLCTKVHLVKAVGFFIVIHVWMWVLEHNEGWALKKWCFRIVVLEKTLESPLDSKEIKPFNPKGSQPWIFFQRTDAEAPILWPPDTKSWFIGKDPDAGKDWGQQEKRVAEDDMVRWRHQLNAYEFEQTLGDMKDRGTWCAAIHGVTKSPTGLSDWTTRTVISRQKETKPHSGDAERLPMCRGWHASQRHFIIK